MIGLKNISKYKVFMPSIPKKRPIGRKSKRAAPQIEPKFKTWKTMIAQEYTKFAEAAESRGLNHRSRPLKAEWDTLIHKKAYTIMANQALEAIGVGRVKTEDRRLRKQIGVLARRAGETAASKNLMTRSEAIAQANRNLVNAVIEAKGRESSKPFRAKFLQQMNLFERAIL